MGKEERITGKRFEKKWILRSPSLTWKSRKLGFISVNNKVKLVYNDWLIGK